MTTVTRRYRFAASHRLHVSSLGDDENAALYGKCNNPFGHGHDYVLDVSVGGPVDPITGKMFAHDQLNRLVDSVVLRRFEHRNLNVELPEFQAVVPTTENISLVIVRLLEEYWYAEMPRATALVRVYVEETPRNSFEVIRNKSPKSPEQFISIGE